MPGKSSVSKIIRIQILVNFTVGLVNQAASAFAGRLFLEGLFACRNRIEKNAIKDIVYNVLLIILNMTTG